MSEGKLHQALHSQVGKNVTWLSVLQVANYLIPLVVIPFVARVLGDERFGQVSYAQNIVAYLTLFIAYGFEFSATRQIALASSKEEENGIFWSVIGSKLVLLVASFAILAVLPLFIGRMQIDPTLYWATALTNIGLAVFPTWFFQGKQDMRIMAILNFLIKFVGAAFVISLVRQESDYLLYPLLLSLSSIAIGIGALVYAIRHYRLAFQGFKQIKECARKGFPIFLNNVCVSLYTTMNLTILGIFVTDAEIGHFSGAQRLIQAVIMIVVMPVSTAFFPKIAAIYEQNKRQGMRTMWRLLGGASLVAAVISVLVYAVAPIVIQIMLGDKFTASLPLLRQMAPMPLLVMAATILTVQGIYALGFQRWAPLIGITVAAACIGSNLWLIPLYGPTGAVVSWGLAELVEILLDLIILLLVAPKKLRNA